MIPRSAPCASCGAKRRTVAGKDLRKVRIRAGYKRLADFAEAVGRSPSYLSEIETGVKNATAEIVALYEALRAERRRT